MYAVGSGKGNTFLSPFLLVWPIKQVLVSELLAYLSVLVRVFLQCHFMASDRMRKKIKDYAEIFGHIMRKHALIMRKLHRIMRKLKQVIKLIIRPVQCIYMLTVNP